MNELQHTGNGFIVEGPLMVLPEDDSALVQIGDVFFDDLLRRRFSPAVKNGSTHNVVVTRVRVTVEMLEA